MYKNLLTMTLFFISSMSFSQNLLEPVPVSWQQLKNSQSKIATLLKEDFMLSPQCFQDMKSYEKLPQQTFIQTILWTTYVWKKYQLTDGLFCLIMINDFAGENETFQVLSTFESTVLLSAAKGMGFEEKGYYEFSDRINALNSSTISKKLQNIIIHTDLADNKIESHDNIIFDEKNTSIIFPQQNNNIQQPKK